MRLLLLLLLLAVQAWGGAPVLYLLDALDPDTTMMAPLVGLPVVQRTDAATAPGPTVIGVRDVVIPASLTCDAITVDVPLGRQWPSIASLQRDPARIHFFRWPPPYNIVAGAWGFNQAHRDAEWAFATPANGTWAPHRSAGLYRFTLGGGTNPLTTWSAGVRYGLGVYLELAGTARQNMFEWLGATATTSGTVGRYCDVYGNAIANATAAGQQMVFTAMPKATNLYTVPVAPGTGTSMTYLALTIYGLCRGTAPAGMDSFVSLPAPSWTRPTSPAATPTPSDNGGLGFWALAGIIFGCILFLIVLLVALFVARWLRHRRQLKELGTRRDKGAYEPVDVDTRTIQLEDMGVPAVIDANAVRQRTDPGPIQREEDAAHAIELSMGDDEDDDDDGTVVLDPRQVRDRIEKGVASTADLMSQ